MPLLWEQLPEEGPKAFEAFSKYLALEPARRSIDTAYRGASKRLTGRAPRRWFTWSAEFRWTERASASDAHDGQIRQSSREQRIQVVEEKRVDFELGQLARLLHAEAAIWKTLGQIEKRSLAARLDPGYRGLHKTALLLGREIVNGPRKAKPTEAQGIAGDRVLIEVRFISAKPAE